MADYHTRFSCLLPVGSAANVASALSLYERISEELDEKDETVSFAAEADGDDTTSLWLHDDAGEGDIKHVMDFVLRCATTFKLTGRWGLTWALTCSKARLDGFGGGAQVLDLGRRESVAWVDCDHWLRERVEEENARPGEARKLLDSVANEQGWTDATQIIVLLDALDALIALDPAVAKRLKAHLAETARQENDWSSR